MKCFDMSRRRQTKVVNKLIPAVASLIVVSNADTVLLKNAVNADEITEYKSMSSNLLDEEKREGENSLKNVVNEVVDIAFGGVFTSEDDQQDENEGVSDVLDIVFGGLQKTKEKSWLSETLDIVFGGVIPVDKDDLMDEDDSMEAENKVANSRDDNSEVAKSKDTKSKVSNSSGKTFPLILQTDPKWASYSYATGTMAQNGCAIACISMVVSGITGEYTIPTDVADWAGSKYYRSGVGTTWDIFNSVANKWNLKVKTISKNNSKEMISHLKEGNPIIVSMGKGTFTRRGHFIVLTGLDEDGKVTVNDPSSEERSKRSWDLSQIIAESSPNGGAPFWAFSK